jgi:hypothetical protein
MRVIFVSGLYTGETGKFSEVEDNIRKAENISIQLYKKGWAVFTPHKNMAHEYFHTALQERLGGVHTAQEHGTL